MSTSFDSHIRYMQGQKRKRYMGRLRRLIDPLLWLLIFAAFIAIPVGMAMAIGLLLLR
jgi:hypothetical protein